MPKQTTDYSSVTLLTWGTHQHGGNGMAHFIDAGFFGGNVGHAAIAINIPCNKASQALIRKYCMKGNKVIIPFERTTQNIFDDNNEVKKQDVYKIYFSWWPGEKTGFDLRPNLNNDNLHERSGVDVGEIDLRFTHPGHPHALKAREKRTYHGILGSRQVNLSEKEIAHLSSLTEKQKYLLEQERNLRENEDKIESWQTLSKKLEAKSTLKIEGSLRVLLDNHIPDWKTVVKNSITINQEDIEKLKEKLIEEKVELIEEKDILTTKRDHAKSVVESDQKQKLEEEIIRIAEALAKLSPEEQLSKIHERDPQFSEQAWVNYELSQVQKILIPAQSISVFCLMNNFNTNKQKIIEILFDKKYPPTLKDSENLEKWRQFLPPEHQNVTKESMTAEIYLALQRNAKSQKDSLFEKQNALFMETLVVNHTDPFFQGDYEQFVTRGHSPDNQIHLPVSGIKNGEQEKLGLNVERMLMKMRDLTDDGKKFDLATKNCSMTTGAILASGAESHLRSYFQEKAWGGFGNPQEVYNGAIQYQKAITTNHGRKTLAEKISAWNPLNIVSWAAGKMLNKVASPDTSIASKIALAIALIPMGLLAAGVETFKAALNPKKSLNNCTNFVNYAWSNPSIFLKICSLPAAILAGALAIPAAIQYGIQKAIIEPLTKTTHQRAQELLETDRTVKLQAEQMIQIDEPHPELAIAKLSALLTEEPDKIPTLTIQTQSNVDSYLRTLNKNKPDDAAKIEVYESTVQKVYARVNEQSKISLANNLNAFEHFKENKPSEKGVETTPPTDNTRQSKRL